MKRTNTYKLGYFEKGDRTSTNVEIQRWATVDAQLQSLFNIVGNGVYSGWEFQAGKGLSLVITPGSGNVSFVSVLTSNNVTINGITGGVTNYIYAHLLGDSYWTRSVGFSSYISIQNNPELLYLGYVNATQTDVLVLGNYYENRPTLGFKSLIEQLLSTHKHIGGIGNPSPIDLSSQVQGVLNQNNLPDIDASIVSAGTLDIERIPQIDHLTKVTNAGSLTHLQLDSFVQNLNNDNKKLMGETSTINLLQLILSLKHIYPEIDDFLVNQIAYIPGISPDSFVDWINTTATVDTRTASEGGQHTITGTPSTGLNLYEHIWDTADDYIGSTSENTLIDGNTVTLSTTINELILDTFNDVAKWKVTTSDLSSVSSQMSADNSTYVISTQSGKVSIGGKQVVIELTIQKKFDAQDWTSYKYLTFYLKTDSVDHGDLYFSLNDSKYGTQGSSTLVIPRNTVTVNNDTLINGWQEYNIDISKFNRSSIDTLTFSMSSQNGWDTSIPFSFNIDSVALKAGNIYKNNGYIRVVFGSDFYYRFWKVKWDAIIPTDSDSSGLVLKERNRVANSVLELSSAPWSGYTASSGDEIALETDAMYKYIEIEMYFEASTALNRAATLTKLYLDFYVNDSDNHFTFDTKNDWDSGSLFNIDTQTNPGSIVISKTDDIGNYLYGSNGDSGYLDGNLNVTYYQIGTNLPRSTYQAKNNLPPSLGQVTGIQRGNNGNIWVSDIDNDRVVEMDKYGGIVRGFYGSFLTDPIDVYGIEDSGPGSNVEVATSTSSGDTTTKSTVISTLNVLHSIYNSNTGVLYIVFDGDLENIYSSSSKLNVNKIYVKVGTHKIYLNNSVFELLGVSSSEYRDWSAILSSNTEYTQYINQFQFKSHVLKINVVGSDKTTLDYLVNQKLPTISIISPYEQEQSFVSSVNVQFSLLNFSLGQIAGENAIKVKIDNGTWNTIYTDYIMFDGLSTGKHTITAQLYDGSNYLTNVGATVSTSFVVSSPTYNLPFVSLISPKQNQVFSSSPVSFEFSCINFPIVVSGQHVRYSIDNGSPVDYYATGMFTVDNISNGSHTITIYTVDSAGNTLSYPYSSVTSTFIVGYNPNAIAKLYVDSGAIYDYTGKTASTVSRTNLDVCNITFANIYSPIDIQLIPSDVSGVGGGLPTILVSKMRSPSWLNFLGSTDMAVELVRRIAKGTTNDTANQISLNSVFSSLSNLNLIYRTFYLDGHSVVEFDMDGNTVFSNNAAVFSDTKDNAKNSLGSAEKLGSSELLIGDSINQRAIITYTNLSTQLPVIEWQYDSDRYVVDFHMEPQGPRMIGIYNDHIGESLSYVRQGTSITWINNSSNPISIYSGTTNYESFNADPELNRYGNYFQSGILNTGDTFTFSFDIGGSFDYFIYPDILTGTINVTEQRLSSRDNFFILESDGKQSPFSSRLIKVDSYGNVIFSFGEGVLVAPRDVRVLSNGNLLIST